MMAEWVDDPPKSPSMFVLDRRSFGCAGVDCCGHNGLRGVHDEERPAGGASETVGAEALDGRISARYPECCVPYGQLHNDVVTVANSVKHFCAKSPLVERNRVTRTLNP